MAPYQMNSEIANQLAVNDNLIKIKINFYLNLSSFRKSLIMVGGYNSEPKLEVSGKLHRLYCLNMSCKWETLRETLKHPRRFFVVMFIPDSFVECHEKASWKHTGFPISKT